MRLKWLRPEDQPTEPFDTTAIRSEGPVRVSDATVDDWINAAAKPIDQLFDEMDAVLQRMSRIEPVRVWGMRRDMKWLRKHAGEMGLSWGTKSA